MENDRAVAVGIAGQSDPERIPARLVLSTIPVTSLIRLVRPGPPVEVVAAASALVYRSMILIYLVLETDRFTEYDAHYFPEAAIRITRLSEPKNYCLAQRPGTTVLCAELPCSKSDDVWHFSDAQLGELVRDAVAKAGIPIHAPIRQVVSRRLPQAYPIYSRGYRQHFEKLDNWVGELEGVITLGRQGLFAHDNTHHTLAMAYAAVKCTADDGAFDRKRWADHRHEFEAHVVED
jgi:protoporphyrinogen oxidase